MNWLDGLALLALLSGVALTAETFRSEPLWFRAEAPRPGPSPRQRRWMGIGVSLFLSGQLVSLQLQGDNPWWTLSLALSGVGAICMLLAAFLRPTAAEHQRRAQLLRAGEARNRRTG